MGSIDSVPFSNCSRAPNPFKTWHKVSRSIRSGTFRRVLGCSVNIVAATMIGKAAFLEPLTDTVPLSLRPPWIINLSIYYGTPEFYGLFCNMLFYMSLF